jgi:hyperosmotically inducible periplasmic protein
VRWSRIASSGFLAGLNNKAKVTGIDPRFLVTKHLLTFYNSFAPSFRRKRLYKWRDLQMKLTKLSRLWMTGALLAAGIAAAETNGGATYSDTQIAQKLGHEIRMYSRFTIFDNVSFRVNEGAVELSGEVSQPFKKNDLGRIAQRVPGVTSLANELKVLPLSPMDNRLRVQVARAIYRDPVLSRYALQAVPPIHIIVENGHVTLEGIVSTEMEKNVAGIRASGAGLSFGRVVNNLQVENPARKS